MVPVSVGLQNFEYRDRPTNEAVKLLIFRTFGQVVRQPVRDS